MSDLTCFWEGCDQEAIYCPGHAREYLQPELDALYAQVSDLKAEVELLTRDKIEAIHKLETMVQLLEMEKEMGKPLHDR